MEVRCDFGLHSKIDIYYIDANAFLEASFHSFELVYMIYNALELESSWPVAVLMAAKEMLSLGIS